jgi:hypothetical protein
MVLTPKRAKKSIARQYATSIAFGEEDEAPPDPWFNPCRVPATDRARAVIQEIAGMLQVLERYHKMRQRKRRPSDQQRFEGIVAAVVWRFYKRHNISFKKKACGRRSKNERTSPAPDGAGCENRACLTQPDWCLLTRPRPTPPWCGFEAAARAACV